MKFSFTISVLCSILIPFVFSDCSKSKNSIKELKLSAHLGGINWIPPYSQCKDKPTTYSIDTSRIYHIITTLENSSDDSVYFAGMMCSYEDSYWVSDTVNYSIQSRMDCFSNGPSIGVIPPRQKRTQYIMVRQFDRKTDPYKKNIRIGFKHITPQHDRDYEAITNSERNKKYTMIWSEDVFKLSH